MIAITLAAWQIYLIVASSLSLATILTMLRSVNKKLVELEFNALTISDYVTHFILYTAMFPLLLLTLLVGYKEYRKLVFQRFLKERV